MKSMQSFIVKEIVEKDYGCEGIAPGKKKEATLLLVSDSVSGTVSVDVEDEMLYQKDINVGDWVAFNHNDELIKL